MVREKFDLGRTAAVSWICGVVAGLAEVLLAARRETDHAHNRTRLATTRPPTQR